MKLAAVAVVATAALALTACGLGRRRERLRRATGWRSPPRSTPSSGRPSGSVASTCGVSGLTKPGAEPHDLELTPRAVGELAGSDVVVYLAGFQPAVDDAVTTQAADAGFDVTGDADLTLAATDDGHDHAGESAQEHEEHADEAGAKDPHFWLDPLQVRSPSSTALGERFASVDPANTLAYRANAEALVADLRTLDGEFEAGLAQCRSDELVTAHAAFAYLADRYGLSQEGIAGLSPDSEPDATTLRELAAHVAEHGVTTVYSETLLDPALAETLARETGATVAVLDPLEGLTDASAGADYLEVMRDNLRILEQGQGCT